MVNARFLGRVCAGIGASLIANALVSAQTFTNFVAVTPCRVVDTRLANGPLGAPIMSANSTRSFPLPSSSCGLPASATAYSLNVTVVPLNGAPLYYLSIWATGATQPVVSTLNDIAGDTIANAAIVPAGTGGAVSVYVTDASDVIMDVNGYFTSNSTSNSSPTTNNTAVGLGALEITAGAQNTGVGFGALGNNLSGNYNTAVGSTALSANSTGSNNTAFGQSTLASNTTGTGNTAVGYGALVSASTVNYNSAFGYQAMNGATGTTNTALGAQAMLSATGNGNIAIGYQAGISLGIGANNIIIGNQGVSTDANLIRIGTLGTQTATYVAGISGTNVTGGAAVFVNANGQLGVAASSRRYKEDIQPMAAASDKLMLLEPVTFRYKESVANGSQDRQYGLIAEQVAAIYPELAVYGKDGQVETLQYQQLPAMLLNEIQKQHKTIDDLEARIAELEKLVKANAAAASTVAGH